MKKITIFKIILIILFLIFLYIYFNPKEYETNYIVNDYKISEKYSNGYYFNIEKNDYVFKYYIDKKYSPDRKKIKEISEYNKDDKICIIFKIDKNYINPICYKDKELIDFRLIKDNEFKQFIYNKKDISINYINKKINNINLYYVHSSKIAIWNYKGIYYQNKENIKTIDLFKDDVIDNYLVINAGRYLFIPNYNQENTFDEYYLVDLENGTHKLNKLDLKINYESYILGTLDNSIYIVDKKEKNEYKLDLFINKLTTISNNDGLAKIYNKKWEDISITKLVAQKHKFTFDNKISYEIINDHLYLIDDTLNEKVRISDIKKPIIIADINDEVYYRYEDLLYLYNSSLGEIKLINYYEWNFNNINQIFIYNY